MSLSLSRALPFVGAALLTLVACGGQMNDPASADSASLTAARTTSTTYNLVSVDGTATSPFFTCTSATQTESVTGGTIELASNGSFTATVSETVTQNGTTTQQTLQAKGRYTVSGNVVTLRYAAGTVVTGTLSNGTLTITDYPYCGGTHTLVFQQQ
jgi:Lipocalin-like domain